MPPASTNIMLTLSPTGKIYAALTALVVWFALILQIFIAVDIFTAQGFSTVGALVHIFSFFTVITNSLVAICLAFVVLAPASKPGQFFLRSSVSMAVTMYIVFVCIVHTLLLRAGENPQGWNWVANNLLHIVVPVMFLIYWLVFAPKQPIKIRTTFLWLIYPVVYLIYSLIRGSITGLYPYPFINVATLGYPAALTNAALLTIVFWMMSLVFVGINRLLIAKSAKGES